MIQFFYYYFLFDWCFKAVFYFLYSLNFVFEDSREKP